MLLPRRKWKDIKGYEGKYQVSNLGEVRSLNYGGTNNTKIMKSRTDCKGYKRIQLSKNGKPKTYKVHRLVAIAFIPNPNSLPQVNHKNEVKDDNRASNLEWCTNKYNCNYGTRSRRQGESIKGVNNSQARKVMLVNTGKIFNTVTEASNKYNVHRSAIAKCCRGEYKFAGKDEEGNKLIWKYI